MNKNPERPKEMDKIISKVFNPKDEQIQRIKQEIERIMKEENLNCSVREFKDKVYWDCISKYQKLSEDFIREFNLKIEDNWLYKSTEFKKEQIINSGKYKCYKNHFIAYKGVRSDRYSNYNFQYQYLDNNEYSSHADYTNEENSFGLSAWTYEQAKKYCNQCVLKVKIKYEDVARLVHSDNKIRCSKIKIIGEVK